MVDTSIDNNQTIFSCVIGKVEHTFSFRPRVSFEKQKIHYIFLANFWIIFHCSEIKCIIDAFGSHLNVDLQQRSVEFSQLFKTHSNLRPALLEKMPPMQVSRVQNDSNDLIEENENNLIENGSDKHDNSKKTVTNNESVS